MNASPNADAGDAPLDGWTFLHLASGVALARIGINREVAYGLIAGVEIAELVLRRRLPFFRESFANIAADIAAGVGAYEAVRAAND